MQDVRDSVIPPRIEATEDSASAPQLRAALTPMSRCRKGLMLRVSNFIYSF